MITLFLNLILSLIISPVYAAASPTPTAEITGTQPDSTSPSEIMKLRQAVQEKVREKLKEITSTSAVNSKRAYIGTVTQINSNEISIDYKNQVKKLSITPETVYIDSKRNKSKFENIKVGQDLLAMGTVTETGDLDTKRVLLIDLKTMQITTQVTLGQVVDISKSSSMIVLVPSNNKNNQYQITFDAKTEFTDKNGKKLSQSDLNTGNKIVTVIKTDPKNTKSYTALKIIILTETKTSPSPTPKD